MRAWLFYKAGKTPEGVTTLEFRRFDFGKLTDFLPDSMRGVIECHGPEKPDVLAKRIARNAHWSGDPPREAVGPLAEAVLQGRWNLT